MDTYLKAAFGQGKIQLFVGSGLSIGFYPSANELKEKLLDEIICISGKERSLRETLTSGNQTDTSMISLEDVAEYFEIYEGSVPLINIVKQTFGDINSSSELHRRLWLLPKVKWIYTTNFDCLIEDALRYQQQPEVITGLSNSNNIDQSKRVVFKIHGCARKSLRRDEFVITRSDYLEYTHRKPLEELKTILDKSTRVFLFLGYSLKDNNMRHIIHEACKMASGIISYAVVREPYGPEVEYWHRMGVHLIDMNIRNFLNEVSEEFPVDESEWSTKIELRVEQKQKIARKGINIIKRELESAGGLNIILDAGSSCYYLAQEIIKEILNNKFNDLGRIKLISNSPPIIEEISKIMLSWKPEDTIRLFCIGGELRYHTQAFAPYSEDYAISQLDNIIKSPLLFTKTLAFIGAAAVNEEELKTKTEHETEVKKAFINAAEQVYILTDHSKYSPLRKGHIFWKDKSIMKQKISIITDIPDDFRMLEETFKEVI